MKKSYKYAINFISEVAGKRKFYILMLLVVQMILGISSVLYALLLRNVIDAAVDNNKNGMLLNIGLFVGLVIGQIFLRAVVRFMEEYSKSTYENAFKTRLFGELLCRDYGAVTATHSGEWMNRLTSDTVVVAEGLATIIPGVAGMVTKMVGALLMILIIEPRFGYILIPGGLLLVLLTYIFRKQLKKLHKQMQEKDGNVRIFLQEHFSSLMVVKAFAKEEDTLDLADEKMEEHKNARMKKNHFSNICNIGFSVVMQGAYVMSVIYSAFGIYSGTITYGTLMAILQLIGQIQSPFANITGYLPKYYAMVASGERLMEAEKFRRDIYDVVEQSAANANNFISLGLKNASFSYQPIEENNDIAINEDDRDIQMPVVTKNLNIEIKNGEFVAFTGPSGCGKSTVLKLLMSLYALDDGEGFISYKGETGKTEYMPMGVAQRKLFAYVPQGNQLMSGKIREVVSFADRKKMNDEKSLNSALDISCALEFVSELEANLDTFLGERGCGLSEGQMQRIAIARAICSDRPVLILDEATSALDEATEKKLLENLRSMTDKTVIIVTHRQEVLKVCDRQIEFTEGIGNNE